MGLRKFARGMTAVAGAAVLLTSGAFGNALAAAAPADKNGFYGDSYCGYMYVCFTCENLNKGNDERDIQQIHFYLSEDGLNWTSVNGNKSAFTAGTDYMDYITDSSFNFDNTRTINYGINEKYYSEEYKDFVTNGNSENRFYEYNVMSKEALNATKTGDASVLYPFDGNDQGIRDPYLIRGCKADGSDKDKIWILATDLNIMSDKYGDKVPNTNFSTSAYGNWGIINSKVGSQNIFVYETSDKLKTWTRRYIDVGSSEKLSESSGLNTNAFLTCTWAPEAIYNPVKDNYLVYWSSQLSNSSIGKMIFCCETDDFETFGDVRLYINEKARTGINNYTCIDASQMQVQNEDGSYSYYRVIKNESDAHICLEEGDSVLDPGLDYEDKSLLANFIEKPDVELAGRVSLGNHFRDVQQTVLSSYRGSFEGATLFPFYDRNEWCVMVDNYGYMAGRYFPLVSSDLGEADSIEKVESGYGRSTDIKTGLPEVACHGGMIPITASEYNSILDVYNSDPGVENYHEIDYIPIMEPEPTKAPEPGKTVYPSQMPSAVPYVVQTAVPSTVQSAVPSSVPAGMVSKPSKVKITSLRLNKKQLTAKWKKVKGAKGYTLWLSTSKYFKTGVRKINTRNQRYVFKNLKPGKNYYFKIAAYINGTNSKRIYSRYSNVYKRKSQTK